MRFLFSLIAAALAFAAAFGHLPSPALASETPDPPPYLAPYGLDWIGHIAPEDLPPSRMAVCVVDSGLPVNPDLPPDDPTAGPILARLSVDGGDGAPQGTSEAQLHGAHMAMAMVAPVNGWGTVGVAPWGRVVSVRALVDGETSFRPSAYRRGIQECLDAPRAYSIAVINLSLGCGCTLSPD
ncbi:MAG: Subtilase family, partial [Solirubrobacteraceae bacterium]|nr:Subtilase family [Solirubrobacteraceae bacterium]